MEFSFQDGRRLWSLLWNKEDLLQKKRRWLMQSESIATVDGGQKRFKRPKFMSESYVSESYNDDEVLPIVKPVAKESKQTIRSVVERSFGSFSNEGRCFMVQDYFLPFDVHDMEVSSVNKHEFSKIFFSMIGNLNDDALLTVARIVTKKNVSFQKNRTKMKKFIKDHFPLFLRKQNDDISSLEQLSDILRRPGSYQEKHFKIGIQVSETLLTSMHTILERLHEMSFNELNAMNRKLRGVSVVLRFPLGPLGRHACTKDLLLERVKRKCKKILDSLMEGDYLPKPFAKALSVMHLSMKNRIQTTDIPESGFFPFSPEVVRFQNDIIRALWSLSKMKHEKLKALHNVIDPKARIPNKIFRNALKKYLMEYLFECDETKPPKEVVVALDVLNSRPQLQIPMLSEEAREEEVEDVMCFSCQLRKFAVSQFPDILEDEYGDIAESEIDVCRKTDAFTLSSSDYFSLAGCENSYYESGSNFEVECNHDSRSAASTSSRAMAKNCCDLSKFSCRINIGKDNKSELDFDDDGTTNLCLKESINQSQQNNKSKTDISVEDLSNETALVAYRIIGRMLDKLIRAEDTNADFRTRSYLNGGSLPSQEFQAPGGFSSASNGDKKGQVLLETIQELLPALPKRCLQSINGLMKVP